MSVSILPVDKVITYPPAIEEAADAIEALLSEGYNLSRRAVALLLLQYDEEIEELVRQDRKSVV